MTMHGLCFAIQSAAASDMALALSRPVDSPDSRQRDVGMHGGGARHASDQPDHPILQVHTPYILVR
jgi:hypothetical protein